ncbi:uncharacterized protein BDZ99DRAFT_469056 [Mytilinidion resinicola]|uniref:Large ribosomal subunit protein P1 n=1 Tax=Mytilinidion resinicola TaxID=574789 RepID=A0A6A6Y3D5_9PEZI|nr:uncharacterized protein BDZ99DRAFT_469056 [Mytilinidion resinicola]KAF2802297.1 hypothetical protein BDZ99DRAFT_469056 [Mytilinidion resinicola]
MSTTTNPETATAYAALILADAEVAITAEKLMVLIRAAGIQDVEPIWASLFAKALEGRDVKELMLEMPALDGENGGEGKKDEGKEGEEGEGVEHEDCCYEGSRDDDSEEDGIMGLFD